MAVDIQQLFNESLPSDFARNADAAKQIGGTFQINITGESGGEWFVDVSDSGPKIEQGNPGLARVTLTLSSEDFHKLYEHPQANMMQLFFSGKLKIVGDNMLAMKLPQIFSLG